MMLSDALAERLAAIVPPGFRVTAYKGVITITSPGVHWQASSYTADLLAGSDDAISGITSAAYNALSVVQDYISEVSAAPWPARAGTRQMLGEELSIVDGRLLLAYGIGTDAVTLPPIWLSDLEDEQGE